MNKIVDTFLEVRGNFKIVNHISLVDKQLHGDYEQYLAHYINTLGANGFNMKNASVAIINDKEFVAKVIVKHEGFTYYIGEELRIIKDDIHGDRS